MNDSFLLGPISSGFSFMMVSIQGTTPYILTTAPLGDGVIYYWESNVLNSSIPIFSSNGPINNVTIIDSSSGGGIGFRSDGKTIGNAQVPTPLNMVQTKFATWWPPDTFIYGPTYTIFNSSGATASIFSTSSPTGPTIPANNILILPVLWYFPSTTPNTCNVINTPGDTVLNWLCNVNQKDPNCQGVQTYKGWSNLTDCLDGVFYQYCLPNQTCGNNNCNGPCQQIYYDCDYSSPNFVCTFNPTNFFTESAWYSNPYFIGAVVAIVLVIIIVLIGLFLAIRSARKNTDQSKFN